MKDFEGIPLKAGDPVIIVEPTMKILVYGTVDSFDKDELHRDVANVTFREFLEGKTVTEPFTEEEIYLNL